MVYCGERKFAFQAGVVFSLILPVRHIFNSYIFRKLVVECVGAVVYFVQPSLAEPRARCVGGHKAASFAHVASAVCSGAYEEVEIRVGEYALVVGMSVECVSVYVAEKRTYLLVFRDFSAGDFGEFYHRVGDCLVCEFYEIDDVAFDGRVAAKYFQTKPYLCAKAAERLFAPFRSSSTSVPCRDFTGARYAQNVVEPFVGVSASEHICADFVAVFTLASVEIILQKFFRRLLQLWQTSEFDASKNCRNRMCAQKTKRASATAGS